MKRRGAVFAVFALAAGLLTGVQPFASDSEESADGSCGVERWSVKTGTDADAGAIDLAHPVTTTIAAFTSLPKPASLPSNNRIMPTETTVYSITATLTLYKHETDSDYHVVISDGTRTMIVESADIGCVGPGSPLAAGIQQARSELDAQLTPTSSFKSASIPVRVTGVGFFDFLHGQTGVAPNGIELHPLLDVAFNPVASACDTAGTPTSTTYLPNITRRLGGASGWDTPFYVQNAGTIATTVEASFYDFASGALIACHKTTALAPGASVRDDPNAAADLVDDKQYAVVVRSFGAPVVATVNQSQTSGGKVEALSYDGFSSGATTVYVPNVTRRFYGYDIPLIVQNLGGTTASVTANFVSFDGTQNVDIPLTIGTGLSGVIDPDYTPGLVDQTQYAVKLTSNQPIAVVANAHNEAIGPVAFSHNGLAAGASTVYGAYATKGQTFSNVVVQNVGAVATTATLSFTPTSGGAAQVFTMPMIAAGQAQAFDVRFDNGVASAGAAQCGSAATATCLGDGDYGLTVTGNTAGASIAAVVLPNSDSTAGAYLAATGATTKGLLPIVQRGVLGWTASIWLQSVTASGVTLRYYAVGSSSLAATQSVVLVPGATTSINAAAVSGLVGGREYSVVIDGSGTLTAAVLEFNPAPGDGLMLYEGFEP